MSKILSIIAATYNQAESGHLQAFVYSLVTQTSKDFVCYVVHDGPADTDTKTFMDIITDKYPENFVFLETPKKSEYKYGHASRSFGLSHCTSPYVTFTNGDNLYVKDYVKIVLEAIEQTEPDIVTNNIIHDYFGYTVFGNGNMGMYATDFANFIIRTEMAKDIPLVEEEYCADGQFCVDLNEKYKDYKNTFIEACLVVHQ